MSGRWTGADGWPRDFPDGVAVAIQSLPNGDTLDEARIAFLAELIAHAAIVGRDEERPAALPSSRAQADGSLRRLHDLCGELAQHLESLRRPAIDALRAEGLEAATFRLLVEEAQYAARCAFGGTSAPERKAGRNPSRAAALVTAECASVYETVTGRRPTFTRDPHNSTVSGPWIDFLGAVFSACYIAASLESQASALMEKMGRKAVD